MIKTSALQTAAWLNEVHNINNINITGTNRLELIQCVYDVAEQLNIDLYEGFVDVDFVDKCTGGAAGYADGDTDLVNVEIAFNDGRGEIPTYLIKRHIAHEFIHAQQLLSGRLVHKGLRLNKKEDKISYVIEWEGVDHYDVRYEDQPWEIEAYALETKIMEKACA